MGDRWGVDSMGEMCARIKARLAAVREQIAAGAGRAGRDPAEVTIVVVTKSFPVEVVRAAAAVGLREIGENRVQEAMAKKDALTDLPDLNWHLVGHLQRNKARHAVLLFDRIHSLDSRRLAETLDQRAEEAGRVVPVLLEVNVGGEESKYGFAPEEETLFPAVEQMLVLSHLRLEGLMTVAPLVDNPEDVRPVFARLRQLRDLLRRHYPQAPWTQLSMGMTDDYEVAVEEGATLVRLGRAILGPRQRQRFVP